MYKNKFVLAISTVFALAACSTVQSGEQSNLKLGTSAIQFAAQTKCNHDIDDFAAWKIARKTNKPTIQKLHIVLIFKNITSNAIYYFYF